MWIKNLTSFSIPNNVQALRDGIVLNQHQKKKGVVDRISAATTDDMKFNILTNHAKALIEDTYNIGHPPSTRH